MRTPIPPDVARQGGFYDDDENNDRQAARLIQEALGGGALIGFDRYPRPDQSEREDGRFGQDRVAEGFAVPEGLTTEGDVYFRPTRDFMPPGVDYPEKLN